MTMGMYFLKLATQILLKSPYVPKIHPREYCASSNNCCKGFCLEAINWILMEKQPPAALAAMVNFFISNLLVFHPTVTKNHPWSATICQMCQLLLLKYLYFCFCSSMLVSKCCKWAHLLFKFLLHSCWVLTEQAMNGARWRAPQNSSETDVTFVCFFSPLCLIL